MNPDMIYIWARLIAVQVAKALQDVINQAVSVHTVHCHFKNEGMRLMGKRKRPLFKFHHRRARMEFVEQHL
jgi:hypothetical protein